MLLLLIEILGGKVIECLRWSEIMGHLKINVMLGGDFDTIKGSLRIKPLKFRPNWRRHSNKIENFTRIIFVLISCNLQLQFSFTHNFPPPLLSHFPLINWKPLKFYFHTICYKMKRKINIQKIHFSETR